MRDAREPIPCRRTTAFRSHRKMFALRLDTARFDQRFREYGARSYIIATLFV